MSDTDAPVDATASVDAVEETSRCESPPPAPQPPREESHDPRLRLLQLATELARTQNRQLLVEFLRLRRAV